MSTTYARIAEESSRKLANQRTQTAIALSQPPAAGLRFRAAGGYSASSGGGGGMSPSALAPQNPGGFGSGHRQMAAHGEQLRYYHGWVYAAIRPIATRIAGQSVKVGIRKAGAPDRQNRPGTPGTPKTRRGARMVSKEAFLAIQSAPPLFQKKLIAEGIEPLDSHPVVEAIENPNPVMVQHQLVMFTVACLMLTGKGYWWMTTEIDEQTKEEKLQFYPLPPNWVSPKFGGNKIINGWLVQPRGAAEPIPVPLDEMCYFSTPDPADPLGAKSPLQAGAAAVTIDEKIERSQLQSYDSPKPGVILKAGRMPGPNGIGGGLRPIMTPAQRKQLISAIMNVWGGVENHGLPAIVDGLIEDIVPWSRTAAEMDYVNGEKAKASRIFMMFGVNQISAGLVEGANRASATVADQHLCNNVINPLISMMSQVMTKNIGPRFSKGANGAGAGEKVYIWFEECSPRDEEMILKRMMILSGTSKSHGRPSVTQNELREAFSLSPVDDGDDLPEPPPPQPAGAFGGAGKPAAGGKPPAGGKRDIAKMIDDLGVKFIGVG